MRKAVKRFVLKKPKLRQSWNKYNLYNIYQYHTNIAYPHRTFFQQKWSAKSATRAYHGEHVGEKRWTREFERRLRGVVDMPARYLARYDGSEQAAGRGSGKQGMRLTAQKFAAKQSGAAEEEGGQDEHAPWRLLHPMSTFKGAFRRHHHKMTPYMQMTYAPMERRLEIALHRALFASSPRQARQFCIHGAVKVNGKKMKYGSYMLNPGDLFEVDPDKVMYAAGKDKTTVEFEARARLNAEIERLRIQAIEAGSQYDESSIEAQAKAATEDSASEEQALPDLEELPEEDRAKEQGKRVLALIRSAKDIIGANQALTAKRKQELRGFMKNCKTVLRAEGKKKEGDKISPEELVKDLASSLSKYTLDESSGKVVAKEAEAAQPADESTAVQEDDSTLSSKEIDRLTSLLRNQQLEDDENPVDPSKPYATPWAPRKWLRPFAFIPRYLEVNQNICAAVYLRHPVARYGLAEVPTPFAYDVNQLAYNWYLRRR